MDTVNVKIPDTITSWHVNGFAMSQADGIGIAKPTSVRGFQPFFVSVTLPYSVKRGEIVKVPATVFNYLDECLIVSTILLYFSRPDLDIFFRSYNFILY